MAERAQRVLEDLLPKSAVCATLHMTQVDEAALHPAESHYIASRGFHPRRIRQFIAGRACARAALAKLGVHDWSLLPSVSRAPVWPSGTIGSITHSERLAAAVVDRSSSNWGIGVDIEEMSRVGVDLAPLVLSAFELASPLPNLELAGKAAVYFSAKESVFKSAFPATSLFLDFHDIELRFEAGTNCFTATPRNGMSDQLALGTIHGAWALCDGCVVTVAVLPHP